MIVYCSEQCHISLQEIVLLHFHVFVCLHCALSAFIVLCCHLYFLNAFLCDCTCCHAKDYKNRCILYYQSDLSPGDVCILLLLTPVVVFSVLHAYCYG